MNKKKRIIDFKNVYLLVMFIASLFMCIGYASVNSVTLNLGGLVSVEAFKGIFLSDITILSSSSESHVDLFYETMMQSTVVLEDNINSTLSMQISVYNNSSDDYYFDDVVYGSNFYDNNNIDYTLSGINHGDKISIHETKTFNITFKYTDEYKNSNPTNFDNVLNSYINFKFIKGYSISYTGLNDTSGLDTLILDSQTKTITFTNQTGIPTSVSVTGATAEYISPNLTLSNPTSNVTVTATIDTGIITDNTTTTYDHNTLQAGTTTIFNNIAGKPKVVVDENGKVISFEYTDVGSGVIINTGNSIDTGVDAFDNRGYTIHLKYKLDTSQNTGKMILTAMNNTNGKKYNGFALFVNSATKYYLNATTNPTNMANSQAFGSRLNTNGWNTSAGEKEYTFDLTYSPSPNKAITASLTPVTSGSSNFSANQTQLGYYPDSINDVSIMLGGSSLAGKDVVNMTVLEFSVSKN